MSQSVAYQDQNSLSCSDLIVGRGPLYCVATGVDARLLPACLVPFGQT